MPRGIWKGTLEFDEDLKAGNPKASQMVDIVPRATTRTKATARKKAG